MEFEIRYYSQTVLRDILELPDTLAARYVVLSRRMVAMGPNLGEPHTKAMGQGLFELRLKGSEGIAPGAVLHPGRQANRRLAQLRQEIESDASARIGCGRESDAGGKT